MLLTDKSIALQETLNQMGFSSVEDFAYEKAKELLLKEIAESMKRIAVFEKKYGMDYYDFCKQFPSLPQPIFEKEEDSAEWHAEIKLRESLLQKLSKFE